MQAQPRAYIASPYGFSELGRIGYYGTLVPLVTQIGFEVLDPWSLTPLDDILHVADMPYGKARRVAWSILNRQISTRNDNAIKECHCVVAILDGTDVDSGTATEIARGYSLDKIVIGYRGDSRISTDNEGCTVNLQVEHYIHGPIARTLAELETTLTDTYMHLIEKRPDI